MADDGFNEVQEQLEAAASELKSSKQRLKKNKEDHSSE